MVTTLFAWGRTAPARRSTFIPVTDRASVPPLPTLAVAAAITVSVSATGAILPLVL